MLNKGNSCFTYVPAFSVRQDYAFIARAMDPKDLQLEDVLDAIKEGAKRSGVTAERIDEAALNEPITKRMLTPSMKPASLSSICPTPAKTSTTKPVMRKVSARRRSGP